jgi:hypothetical protein
MADLPDVSTGKIPGYDYFQEAQRKGGNPIGAALVDLLTGGGDLPSTLTNFLPGPHVPIGPAIAGWMTRTQLAKMLGPGQARYLKNIPSAALERLKPENVKLLNAKEMRETMSKLGVSSSPTRQTEGFLLPPEMFTLDVLKQYTNPFAKELSKGESIMGLLKGTRRPLGQLAEHETAHEASARLGFPYIAETKRKEELLAEAAEVLHDFSPQELEAVADVDKTAVGEVIRRFEQLKKKVRVPLTPEQQAQQFHSGTGGIRKSEKPSSTNQSIIDRIIKQLEAEKNPEYKKKLSDQLERAKKGKSTLIGYKPEGGGEHY